jgi:cell division protein FtsB
VITSVDTYFHASYNKMKEHQHLWKFLVITLILLLMILLHLFYAGIDGIKVVLNSHQQLPHTWPLLVRTEGIQIKVVHDIQRHEASIVDIPNDTLH